MPTDCLQTVLSTCGSFRMSAVLSKRLQSVARVCESFRTFAAVSKYLQILSDVCRSFRTFAVRNWMFKSATPPGLEHRLCVLPTGAAIVLVILLLRPGRSWDSVFPACRDSTASFCSHDDCDSWNSMASDRDCQNSPTLGRDSSWSFPRTWQKVATSSLSKSDSGELEDSALVSELLSALYLL
jgi:hypothetical protein